VPALSYHVSSVGCPLPERSRGDGLYEFHPSMTQVYGYDRTNEVMNRSFSSIETRFVYMIGHVCFFIQEFVATPLLQ
jgi:hypothetical protein